MVSLNQRFPATSNLHLMAALNGGVSCNTSCISRRLCDHSRVRRGGKSGARHHRPTCAGKCRCARAKCRRWGLQGQAGLDEAVPLLRAVQYPLPFFCSAMKWCFTSFSSGGLWCVCVLSSQGVSIPNRSDAAKDWEELVLQGAQHQDVQLGHSDWHRAALHSSGGVAEHGRSLKSLFSTSC